MGRILVLGSLNIDLVQRVPHLPRTGETIRGDHFAVHVGGKGANQACAAARLGGAAVFAGMLGSDVFATRIRRELSDAGVDLAHVQTSPASSGVATILVLPSGDNSIVIAPGANADVSPQLAIEAVSTLASGDFLLCQLEIPLASVHAGLAEARSRGVTTILDPAPVCDLPASLLDLVDILTPNQTEAAAIPPLALERIKTVVFKLGREGCRIRHSASDTIVPGFQVAATDTTAAGDTFNGALAVALHEGRDLTSAARFANAAAAISVTRPGAIPSVPSRLEVNQFLAGKGAL